MQGRTPTFGGLFLACLVSVAGLAWGPARPFFIASCLVCTGLVLLLVWRGQASSTRRTYEGYEPCPMCASDQIERVDDDIHYMALPMGDMVRHYVRCTRCGCDFESRVGGGGF